MKTTPDVQSLNLEPDAFRLAFADPAFMLRAKALVAFPGGFGTFDELFEILTSVQTHKSQKVPILLYGSDYWRSVIDFDAMLAQGTISAEDAQCFQYVDSPEAARDLVKSCPMS